MESLKYMLKHIFRQPILWMGTLVIASEYRGITGVPFTRRSVHNTGGQAGGQVRRTSTSRAERVRF